MAHTGSASARHLIHDGKDLLIAVLICAAAAVTGGVWVWGQTAGILTGRWPTVRLADGFHVAAHLPAHWTNPREAWPPSARAALPGAATFYLAGFLALLLLCGVSATGVWAWARWRRRSDGFATRKQLATHLAAAAVLARGGTVRPSLKGQRVGLEQVGVRLGRSHPDRVDLAVSAEDSVLVFAAPRQGKTSQVLIPWTTSWPGPALVTSLRPDLLLATAALRERDTGGPVAVMAPTDMIAWPTMVRWSPTDGCRDLDKARRRAEVMVTVGRGTGQDSSNAGYFGANATNLLTLWLHTAAIAGRGMRDVLGWALDDTDQTPIKLLRDHDDTAAAGAADLLDGLYRTPPETKSGLWTTVQTAVAPLLSPTAQRTFCANPADSIDLDRFLQDNGTIYLMVADQQARALAPLISAFVDELIETAKARADASSGGRLDPPLGLLLDEVANVAPLPSLPGLMSFSGGSGIFVTGVLQSRAQADERFGRDAAAMLWGAATVKIIMGGLSGDEPRHISELAGEYEKTQFTYHRADDGSMTTQTSTQDKKVLDPAHIRCLDPTKREALIIHATTPAVKVHMTRHYEGPHKNAHAEAERAALDVIQRARASADCKAGSVDPDDVAQKARVTQVGAA